MGFLNEQIDVNIKMSKRVKYFFIGLFIGILSSFIGIYIIIILLAMMITYWALYYTMIK